MKSIGERIKELRETNGLNQLELAKILNVHKGSVSNWENNKRTPDAEMLTKIANFFNCSIDYLMGNSDIKKSINSFNKQNQKQNNFSSMLENELKKANLYNENMKPEEKLLLANKILNILKLIDNK